MPVTGWEKPRRGDRPMMRGVKGSCEEPSNPRPEEGGALEGGMPAKTLAVEKD